MEIRDVHALLGRTAYGADGDRLGTITGAYLDDATGRASWVTVERGGLFRTTRSFVPLAGAEAAGDGVRVAVGADAVRTAPHVDDDHALTVADERELLGHYGLDSPLPADDDAADGRDATAAGHHTADDATEDQGTMPDRDTEPDAMTRSEERPVVGTTTVATSRAVLRTTRVVEDRTFSVPLARDQVQVVYEPLPEGAPAHATAPAQATRATPEGGSPEAPAPDADDDGWVVLYEERLVVRTEWVPVERVRLRTVGVRGEAAVQVDLRRERIDLDVDGRDGGEAAGRREGDTAPGA
jgi:stress response protein YsnF